MRILLAVVALVGCGVARGDAEWRIVAHQPAEYGLTGTRIDFTSSAHLRVAAWWIAAAPDRPGHATVVLVHGRGNTRATMLPRAKFLVAAGYDVLAIDLRAHGDSAGDYPSPGYLEAAEVEAAVAEAHRRSPSPVVLLGHSVGGVAVLHAASHRPAIAGAIA